MIVKVLVENTSLNDDFLNEHGLSIYVETSHHKILFDLGQTGIFLNNAVSLGINIRDIDTVVISHGHYDHGGALGKFLTHNSKAKVYLRKDAFDTHLSIHNDVKRDIGLDKKLKDNERIVYVDKEIDIDEELTIFADIKTKDFISKSNDNLYSVVDGYIVHDDFSHEQSLLIRDHGKSLLLAGCAHRGIVNILRRATELNKKDVDYCIGGFHLSSPRTGKRESDELINKVSKELLKFNTKYFTCHCTGIEVYNILKESMKNKLEYAHAGSVFILE